MSEDAESAVSSPLERANQRIRDAAKWLIASSAAVGAALIAGSQLSAIGRLDVGWPTSLPTGRLWVAVAGGSIALTAVVYIVWTGVQLLLPSLVLIQDVARSWNRPTGTMIEVVGFFHDHPKYLQGFSTPAQLIEHRGGLVAQLAGGADVVSKISDADQRISAVEDMASHQRLVAEFRRTLRKLLPATAAAALGIIAFAWAANPPIPSVGADLRGATLIGSSLRDADLSNAKLDGADLTRADLTGAKLAGASLRKVIWQDTTCPDGTLSNKHGNSCAGHLSP